MLAIMTLGIMTLGIMTLGIMTLGIMAIVIKTLVKSMTGGLGSGLPGCALLMMLSALALALAITRPVQLLGLRDRIRLGTDG